MTTAHLTRAKLHVVSPRLGWWSYTVIQDEDTSELRLVAWGLCRSWREALHRGLAARDVYERFPL